MYDVRLDSMWRAGDLALAFFYFYEFWFFVLRLELSSCAFSWKIFQQEVLSHRDIKEHEAE